MYRNVGEKIEMKPMMADEKYYPHLEFTIEQLPEISSWQVGETYELKIKVKQVSHEVKQRMDEQKECAEFEVLAVEVYKMPLTEGQKSALDKLGMR